MAKKGKKKPTIQKTRRAASSVKALSAGERSRVLRAPDNYEELAKKTAAKLATLGRRVRAGISAPKLNGLLRRAERAQAREDKLRAALEAKLRPLADQRLLADGAAWRAVLDVWASVQTAARNDPDLLGEFEFLRGALARPRPPRPDTPPA